MKKCILFMSLLILIILSNTGCTTRVSEKDSTVQVKITDEYHRNFSATPMFVNGSYVLITRPGESKITVEYDNIKYEFTEEAVYEKYHDKVGEYVNATLTETKYDDGTIERRITSLE